MEPDPACKRKPGPVFSVVPGTERLDPLAAVGRDPCAIAECQPAFDQPRRIPEPATLAVPPRY
ncbi:hypothetical protein [Glutamicibacter sp.]|uniref:hypothetical protein n=1 Tax=Glutamicibacter sp. TaxID=1931995 RepID=UPI003D6BA766